MRSVLVSFQNNDGLRFRLLFASSARAIRFLEARRIEYYSFSIPLRHPRQTSGKRVTA